MRLPVLRPKQMGRRESMPQILRGSNAVWCAFLSGDEGQDLVEYSLVLAAIALAGAAAYLGMSRSANSLWSAANSRLAAANSGS